MPLCFYIGAFLSKLMTMARKYNFLKQVNKRMEVSEKAYPIGLIINSLQQPFKNVVQAVCEKQKKDVDELYKTLGWKK